jgi:hypothetical protein
MVTSNLPDAKLPIAAIQMGAAMNGDAGLLGV